MPSNEREAFSTDWVAGHVQDRLALSARQVRAAYACTYLNHATLACFSSLLDAGCGVGYLHRHLEHEGWTGDYLGCDQSGASLQAAVNLFPAAHFVRGELTALPFASQAFDLGYARDSVIHCSSPTNALEELCRVARCLLLRVRIADVNDFFMARYRHSDMVHQWFSRNWLIRFLSNISPRPRVVRYSAQLHPPRAVDPLSFREAVPFTQYGAMDALMIRDDLDVATPTVIDDSSTTRLAAAVRQLKGPQNYARSRRR